MNLKDKLNSLLSERGRGAKAKLAKYLNVPPAYITRWSDNSYVENLPVNLYPKVAEFFNINPSYFLDTKESVKLANIKVVPIVGNSSCGIPDYNSYQSTDETTYCNEEIWNNEIYALYASGDSMLDLISDGDILLCDPKADVLSGDIVHYQIYGGESAIKVYRKRDDIGVIELIPLNKNFKTLSFRLDDPVLDTLKMVKVININKSIENGRSERLRNLGAL